MDAKKEKLIWSENDSVNVKELDDQHKQIFETLNTLEIALYSPELFEKLLDKMIGYATEHFAAEEKYFAICKYEHLEEHKAQHDEIVAKIVEFRANAKKNPAIKTELLKFLRFWINTHINDHDKKYVECFNKHGLF